MNIRFLNPVNIPAAYYWQCGDGCCSEFRWENEDFSPGEDRPDDMVDISGLVEGIDFERF